MNELLEDLEKKNKPNSPTDTQTNAPIRKKKIAMTITNPVFKFPINDRSKEHIIVDLGIVELKNNYYQSINAPLLSKMHFKAQSLTVLSRLYNAQNKLQLNLIVPPTFADGELTSPLMLNDNHLIADSTLNVKFSPITFNLNLEQVSLLINVSMF